MLHLSISSGSRLGPYEIIGSLGAGSDVMLTGALAGLASGSNLRLALISWNSVADGAAMTGSWSDQIRAGSGAVTFSVAVLSENSAEQQGES